MLFVVLGSLSLACWLGIVTTRGRFWWPGPWLTASGVDDDLRTWDATVGGMSRAGWPSVVTVVPARDEAALLPHTVPTLLAQDYPGPFHVLLVDDHSADATAAVARSLGAFDRLTVIDGTATPAGWAGKVWAMRQGVEAAHEADFVWFTDADIEHAPGTLRRLIGVATSQDRDLVSVMAHLRVETRWEKLLVPAFVYFFAMLYPFRWVARSARTPAAAGGCLLVRRPLLEKSGGLSAMRSALIDDVTLASQISGAGGRLWLGFDRGVRSVRPYRRLADLWHMVARSAYTELDYSPWRLLGALTGLTLLFAVPPLSVGFGLAAMLSSTDAAGLATLCTGAAAWFVQASSYLPTIRQYRLTRWWAPLFPAAGMLYAAMTASSAWQHRRSGGQWKGRLATADESER